MSSPRHYNHPQPGSSWSRLGENLWDSFNGRSDPIQRAKIPSFQTMFQNFGIPPRLQTHLYNVYSTLAGMIALACVASVATWNTPPHPWLWGILNFGAMIWFAFSSPHSTFLSINLQSVLLYTISATTGILIVPLLHMANYEAPLAIPVSLAATTLVFLALTIAAFKADRASVLYYWSGISLAVGALSFYSLAVMLFGLQIIPAALWSTFSIVMTAFAVVLDTQQMLQEYNDNPNVELEYKSAVLKQFWSFSKLFIKILNIMMTLLKQDKDNRRNNNDRRDRDRRQ